MATQQKPLPVSETVRLERVETAIREIHDAGERYRKLQQDATSTGQARLHAGEIFKRKIADFAFQWENVEHLISRTILLPENEANSISESGLPPKMICNCGTILKALLRITPKDHASDCPIFHGET